MTIQLLRMKTNQEVGEDVSKVSSVNVVNYELDKHMTVKQTDAEDCHIPNSITGHLNHNGTKNAVSHDANDITKVVGFLYHNPTEFTSVGPDREP